MFERSARIQDVKALVFRVGGLLIGMDADQIGGVSDVASADERSCKLFSLHELLGVEVEKCARAKTIFARGGYLPESSRPSGRENSRLVGVVTAPPEEILDIPLERLRPVPPLIQAYARSHGIWAVALMPDEMVFMVDMRKMIGSKAGEIRWVN